jgi:hypothetical protein
MRECERTEKLPVIVIFSDTAGEIGVGRRAHCQHTYGINFLALSDSVVDAGGCENESMLMHTNCEREEQTNRTSINGWPIEKQSKTRSQPVKIPAFSFIIA